MADLPGNIGYSHPGILPLLIWQHNHSLRHLLIKLPTLLLGLLFLKVLVHIHITVRLVKISHAHRALFLNNQPLVNAVVMEIVVAWPQHLHNLGVVDGVVADRTVVHFHLRGVA